MPHLGVDIQRERPVPHVRAEAERGDLLCDLRTREVLAVRPRLSARLAELPSTRTLRIRMLCAVGPEEACISQPCGAAVQSQSIPHAGAEIESG
jgi:hypothetical protein